VTKKEQPTDGITKADTPKCAASQPADQDYESKNPEDRTNVATPDNAAGFIAVDIS